MNISIEPGTEYTNSNDTTGDEETGGRLLVWSVLDGIIGTLGILGNGLVILVFVRAKSSRNLFNLFIINQSLIDFTSSLVFLLIHLGPKIKLVPGNLGHLYLCKIWVSEYVMWALFISSSFNLICITLERYVATLKPAWYRKKATAIKSRIVMIAAVVWSLGFIIDWFWAYVQQVFPGGLCIPYYRSKVWQGVGGFTIFIVTYLGPLTVIVFSYSQILLKLRKQAAKVQSQSPARSLSRRITVNETSSRTTSSITPGSLLRPRNQSTRNTGTIRSRATRNVIKTMMIVAATYAISWAPIAFNYVVYNFGGPLDFNSTWYEVTKLFVYANMCANPFVYAMQYRQFQVGLKRLFCNFVGKQTRFDTQTERSGSGADVLT